MNPGKTVNIMIGNHNVASISDFIELLSSELKSSGAFPIFSQQFFDDMLNIVIEAFTAQTNEVIKNRFVKADPRLVLVATEIVQDGMLNSAAPGEGEVVDGWYDKNAAYWVERSKYFFDIVEYFGIIICVSEEIYKSLKKMNLNATLVYWSPKFTNLFNDSLLNRDKFREVWISRNARNVVKTHKFFYSGSPTPYRSEQIEHLRSLGQSVLHCPPTATDSVRHALSKQSKFTFGPRHYRSTVQLSKMRLYWCLNNLFPIIMERCPAQTDLDDYCIFYESVEELLDFEKDINTSYQTCMDKNYAFMIETCQNKSLFNAPVFGQ